MSTFQINTTDDIYQFVERLKAQCAKRSETGLLTQLNDATHMGSSGLEILGALRQVILANIGLIQELLGSDGENEARLIVRFIDKAFGR